MGVLKALPHIDSPSMASPILEVNLYKPEGNHIVFLQVAGISPRSRPCKTTYQISTI